MSCKQRATALEEIIPRFVAGLEDAHRFSAHFVARLLDFVQVTLRERDCDKAPDQRRKDAEVITSGCLPILLDDFQVPLKMSNTWD